ncbi:MAG TPA: hypothetical protein VNZ63_00805 [Verrucomicrobiae bacterium]|nr:hypothetical protein [Verrucomicrobiae bacterium]
MGLLLFSSPIVAAQDAQSLSTDSQQTALINNLLQRIDQLEARVKELEAKEGIAPAPPAQPSAAPPAQPPPRPAPEVSEMPMGPPPGPENIPAGVPSLKIRGFSNVLWSDSDQKGTTNSFALGQTDLFITSALSRRIDMLAEVVFEADTHNAVGVDLERMLLRYSFNDYFKLSAGRYHTAIGFYNTAYHHSTWMQTAIDRPFIFQFEDDGGILPIHNVGVSATGIIPSGRFELHYVAEIGNGRASRTPLEEPVQNRVSDHNGKAFNVALFARPQILPGLQFGASYYHDSLVPQGFPTVHEEIFSAHAVFQGSHFEFLNEGLLIRHAWSAVPAAFNTPAFYTQISEGIGLFRPYFRYQYLNASNAEPIFGDVSRRNGPSLGIRYDFGEFASFKTEINRTDLRQNKPVNGITTQVDFTF